MTKMPARNPRSRCPLTFGVGALLTLICAGLCAAPSHAFTSEAAFANEAPETANTADDSSETLSQVDGLTAASFSIFQRKPLRIGIITLWETPETAQALLETLKTIRRAFAPYPVEIDPWILSKDLEERIRTGDIDVFIASSGFSVRMMKYGVVPLATLITARQPDPNNGIATTFLVRADDNRFQTIGDLKNTRLSASYDTAFMSYRTGLGEIAVRGFDHEHFFSDIHFTGDSNNEPIAARLDTKEADVAMVRACWLEGQPESVRKRYRVLEPQPKDVLRCEHTSRTYPNVMVSILQGSPPGAAHVISRTLLSVPQISPGHHWGVATDMRAVDRLYRELKIENYSYLRQPTIEQWVEEHAVWFVGAGLLLVGLIAHGWRTEYLVRQRTSALRESMEASRRAQARNEELRERMEKYQKAAVVGQLSNLIAHELAQPLAAIQLYCEGLKDLLAGGGETNKTLLEQCRTGIEKALKRTTAIVARVRGYSKNDPKRTDSVAFLPTLERAYRSINAETAQIVAFTVDADSAVWGPKTDETDGLPVTLADVHVLGDPLELELLLSNLLKNAFEAALEAPRATHGASEPVVTVSLDREAAASHNASADHGKLYVRIANTGPVMSEADFATLTTPLITSKKAGHGLGIPISCAIAETSGGNLEFERRLEGGLIAHLTLCIAPKSKAKEKMRPGTSAA